MLNRNGGGEDWRRDWKERREGKLWSGYKINIFFAFLKIVSSIVGRIFKK